MFTVPKTEVATHWWAYAGHVQEQTGTCPSGEYYFTEREAAESYAKQLQSEKLIRRYNQIERRASAYVMSVYRIRSLWNKTIRSSLQAHEQELAESFKLMQNPPEIKVTLLPDLIPVRGARIALGTPVYEVDTYALTMRKAYVEKEMINYYEFSSEGTTARYLLSNGRGINSDLNSGFSNVEQFLDRDQAVVRLRALLQTKIAQLDEELKTLQ